LPTAAQVHPPPPAFLQRTVIFGGWSIKRKRDLFPRLQLMFPRLIFIKLLCVNVAIIKKYLSLKSHTSRKPQAEKEI